MVARLGWLIVLVATRMDAVSVSALTARMKLPLMPNVPTTDAMSAAVPASKLSIPPATTRTTPSTSNAVTSYSMSRNPLEGRMPMSWYGGLVSTTHADHAPPLARLRKRTCVNRPCGSVMSRVTVP